MLQVGDLCDLIVTALGPKNIGIDEFSYGYSILIPNAKLGEIVKAQIIKINLNKAKYAVAKIVSVAKKNQTSFIGVEAPKHEDLKEKLKVGDILTVQLNKIAIQTDHSSIGIVNSSATVPAALENIKLPLSYKLIILVNNQTKVGQEIQIQITKLKLKYGFAKVLSSDAELSISKLKNSLSFFGGHSSIVEKARLKEKKNAISILKKEPLAEIKNFKKENNNNLSTASLTSFGVGGQGSSNLPKPFISLGSSQNNAIYANSNTKFYQAPLKAKLENYGQIMNPNNSSFSSFISGLSNPLLAKQGLAALESKKGKKNSKSFNVANMTKGSKITLTLPKTAKKYAKYLVISVANASHNSFILFIKNLLRAKLGDKVRVKFTKIGSSFAIGQVIRISPNSSVTKLARVRKNINEMLINGMHYGEKVVKCQAKMRNFIWNRKKMSLINNSAHFKMFKQNQSLNKGVALIKKGRHLINLFKTRRCLNIGLNQLTKYAAKGRTFLFVGTKKPAAGLIARAALFSKTSFFVNTRWLGGMLTNWKTIIKSISKIRPILKEKQKVISNILQKRSKIQNRLIKKVLSLRKKSKVLIKKGKQLIAKVKMSNKNSFNENYLKLNQINIKLKNSALERGQILLQKRQTLLTKQNELKEKTLHIKENGFLIANKYKVLLNQLRTTHTKLNDLRLLFLLNKELRKIKKLAKEQGKNKFILSYGKFKQLTNLVTEKNAIKNFNTDFINSKNYWVIPNPPQEILNKLLIKINEISNYNYKKGGGGLLINENNKQVTFGKQFLKTSVTSFYKNQFSIKEKNTTGIIKKIDPSFSGGGDPPKLALFRGTLKKRSLIILTKLLSKFSRFLPYIKNSIKVIIRIMQNLEKKITDLKTNLTALKKTLTNYILFNNSINKELELIKTKYLSEQQIIRVLRRKLKRNEAEKKLLQFLPKLRYLPTPKSQIALAIQLLMKRFVDPKMKYPLDLIYDEKLRKKSKKVAAARKKKWQRLETYFGGIANMTKLKKTQISKNVAIIIGQQEEINAIRECKKLGIKMFHIVDTNCNPGLADHFIPANDDSRNSIKYLLSKMVTRIRLAQKIRLLPALRRRTASLD